MHQLFPLAACLLLAACAGAPQPPVPQAGAAGNPAALHTSTAIPLPVPSHGFALPDAERAPLALGGPLSDYRVYALQLKKGERYRLSLGSPCRDACLGFDGFALKPRALLLDANGAVIASQPRAAVGLTRLSWDGEAPEDGLYYLLVAADGGSAPVIDDVWINNSPLMAVETGAAYGRLGSALE